MSDSVQMLFDDPRPILSVNTEDGQQGWRVNTDPRYAKTDWACEKIVAYREAGEMGYVPALAIYRNGEVIARAPARLMIVEYAQTQEPHDDD